MGPWGCSDISATQRRYGTIIQPFLSFFFHLHLWFLPLIFNLTSHTKRDGEMCCKKLYSSRRAEEGEVKQIIPIKPDSGLMQKYSQKLENFREYKLLLPSMRTICRVYTKLYNHLKSTHDVKRFFSHFNMCMQCFLCSTTHTMDKINQSLSWLWISVLQ